jgi:hypothetical protein
LGSHERVWMFKGFIESTHNQSAIDILSPSTSYLHRHLISIDILSPSTSYLQLPNPTTCNILATNHSQSSSITSLYDSNRWKHCTCDCI